MNRTRALVVSFEVLMGHKLRTFLSSSGIAIGVAAVVLMVGAGQAAQLETQRKVQSMGTNLLVVQAGKFKSVAGRTFQSQRFTTLKPSDVRILQRQVPEVALAGGLIERRANASYRDVSTRTHVIHQADGQAVDVVSPVNTAAIGADVDDPDADQVA